MARALCFVIILLLLSAQVSFGSGVRPQQNDKNEVLAQGNPPLTRGLVYQLAEVFEWVFDIKLTKPQLALFTLKLLPIWQNGNQRGVDALVNARKAYERLVSEPEQRRNEERDRVRAAWLKSYSNEPPDTVWPLLISAYREAHPDASPGAPRIQPPGARSTIPSELVGEWIARSGSGTSYQDPRTGQTGPPNATVSSYKIFANGTYEHGMLMQSALYNCSTTIFGRETGTVTVTASALIFTPRPGTLDYKSTCNASLNSNQTTNFPPETVSWRIERDEYGVKLCLQNAKGAGSCFYKQ